MPEELRELSLDGVRIVLERCQHCGRWPDEADATRAIHEWREQWAPGPCGVCGRPVAAERFDIVHNHSGEWRAFAYGQPQANLTFDGAAFARGIPVHIECLRKVLPFANEEELLEGRRLRDIMAPPGPHPGRYVPPRSTPIRTRADRHRPLA